MINNFFIAGISQDRLREIFHPDKPENLQERVDVKPEVLFSLYEENHAAAIYLNQVFPKKLVIESQEKSMFDPKFFTFMATNGSRETSYMHCLIFYERFAKELIHADFDEALAYTKLKRQQFVIDATLEREKKKSLYPNLGKTGNLIIDDDIIGDRGSRHNW